MTTAKQSRFTGWLLGLTPLLVLVGLWQILVPAGGRTAFLLSRPTEILGTAVTLIPTAPFWLDFLATVRVLCAGYLAGALLGFGSGLLVWLAGRRASIVEGYLIALGAVPVFAVAPLLIFTLGIGERTRFVIVFLAVWTPMSLAAYFAAKQAERQYSGLITSFCRTRAQAMWSIVGPAAFYETLPSLKALANVALVATFLAEWISAEKGLGKFILASMSIYNVPAMWVGLLTLVLVGLAFSRIITISESCVTGWRGRLPT